MEDQRVELHVAPMPFVDTGVQAGLLGVREMRPDAHPDTLDVALPPRSGGDLDAHILGGGCFGRLPHLPDLVVRLPSAMPLLTMSATTTTDTTFVVHGPDNRWSCGDSAGGVDPGVMIPNAAAGQYEVWVGSYGRGPVSGQLHLTASADNHPEPAHPTTPPPPTAPPPTAPLTDPGPPGAAPPAAPPRPAAPPPAATAPHSSADAQRTTPAPSGAQTYSSTS